MVLVSWSGDQDVDLCAFNSKVSEYVNIGHPVDSEQNAFLYADHGSSEPFELLYIHNASDEFKRTIYVTEAEKAKEGSPSRMEDDGVCSIVKQMDTLFKYIFKERQNYSCLSI